MGNGQSKEAREKCDEIQQSLPDKIDLYEGWSDLESDAEIISLYYGKRGRFDFCGYWYVPNDNDKLIEPIQYENGEESEIIIVYKRESINGMKLSEEDEIMLKDKVEALWCSKAKDTNDKTEAIVISLFEARDIIFSE